MSGAAVSNTAQHNRNGEARGRKHGEGEPLLERAEAVALKRQPKAGAAAQDGAGAAGGVGRMESMEPGEYAVAVRGEAGVQAGGVLYDEDQGGGAVATDQYERNLSNLFPIDRGV